MNHDQVPVTVRHFLDALETLEAQLVAVTLEDWDQAYELHQEALRRLLDMATELSDGADSLGGRRQAQQGMLA